MASSSTADNITASPVMAKEEQDKSAEITIVPPVPEDSPASPVQQEENPTACDSAATGEEPITAGFLFKKGGPLKIWRRRFFTFLAGPTAVERLDSILRHHFDPADYLGSNEELLKLLAYAAVTSKGLVFYFKSDQVEDELPLGIIDLRGLSAVGDGAVRESKAFDRSFVFAIDTASRKFALAAESDLLRQRWVKTLRQTISEEPVEDVSETEAFKAALEALRAKGSEISQAVNSATDGRAVSPIKNLGDNAKAEMEKVAAKAATAKAALVAGFKQLTTRKGSRATSASGTAEAAEVSSGNADETAVESTGVANAQVESETAAADEQAKAETQGQQKEGNTQEPSAAADTAAMAEAELSAETGGNPVRMLWSAMKSCLCTGKGTTGEESTEQPRSQTVEPEEEPQEQADDETITDNAAAAAPTVEGDAPAVPATQVTGWLNKQSNHLKVWNRRWFKLDNHKLSYNRTGAADEETGVVEIDSDTVVRQFDGRDHAFTVEVGKKKFLLQAENAQDYEKWYNGLTAATTTTTTATTTAQSETSE